jgi:acyl CoA:acetate/3-ketoacid CoA transferase beta subunit
MKFNNIIPREAEQISNQDLIPLGTDIPMMMAPMI